MKKFMFKVYDESLENFLDCQSNISEFLRDLINDYRQGKLMNADQIGLKQKIENEKYQKLQKENLKLDFEIKRTLIREFKFSPEQAMEIASGEKQISDYSIKCFDCQWSTQHTDSAMYQINRLRDHMELYHHRSFTEEEEEKMSRLLV